MGKKKRRQSGRKSKARLGNLSADELLARGEQALRQGQFQQAIQAFKTALMQGERPEVLAGLGQAYTGRIRQLAGKSMFKEALAMMEIMTQRCPDDETAPLHLTLLLQAGAYAEAADFYRHHQKMLTAEQIARLDVLFGALLLSDSGVKVEQFCRDSALVRLYPVAIESLELFLAGRERETREAVRKIPLRSPYRDLRSLLSGLLKLGHDQAGCRKFLEKIDEGSPYRSSAERYLARFDTPGAILEKLKTATGADRAKLRKRYGLSQGPFKMLLDLARCNGQPRKLLEIVLRHAAVLGKARQHQLIRNIVPFCSHHAFDFFDSFSTIDQLEAYRLGALAAEKDDAIPFAVEFWDDYLAELARRKTPRPLEMAQVLRYQVKLMEPDLEGYGVDTVLESMQKSLAYDPNHVETWLQAAELAARHKGRRRYYTILDAAVRALPENVPVLLAAMRACGQRGAHKKAAALAKRVLAIDSINTDALDFLMESRLEHARKLAKQRKWLLAEKELQADDTRVKALRLRGRRRIALGMVQLLQGNSEGVATIAQGRAENGFVVISGLLTAFEARLFDLPAQERKQFDEELRQTAETLAEIDKTEFLRLCGWLTGFTDRQWLLLKECCQLLKKYFHTAVALDWNREEGMLFCRAMDRAEQNQALAACSKRLAKKFPAEALFAAWNLIALYEKQGRKLPRKKVAQLEDLRDQLETQGEFDFCQRLEKILFRREITDDVVGMKSELDYIFELESGPPAKKSDAPGKPSGSSFAGKQLSLFDDES